MPSKISILFFVTSFILCQNFAYDSDDWYVVRKPGVIYSITEGPFNVYFGTENGIFLYDDLDDIIRSPDEVDRTPDEVL